MDIKEILKQNASYKTIMTSHLNLSKIKGWEIDSEVGNTDIIYVQIDEIANLQISKGYGENF